MEKKQMEAPGLAGYSTILYFSVSSNFGILRSPFEFLVFFVVSSLLI